MGIQQYSTKDGTCRKASWTAYVPDRGCIPVANGSGIAFVKVECSYCEWLRWQGVKNAAYSTMLLNSVCSIAFGALMEVLFLIILPRVVSPLGETKLCGCLSKSKLFRM